MEIAAVVSNLIKSDIMPAIDAGATVIHAPIRYVWGIEQIIEPISNPQFFKVQGFKKSKAF